MDAKQVKAEEGEKVGRGLEAWARRTTLLDFYSQAFFPYLVEEEGGCLLGAGASQMCLLPCPAPRRCFVPRAPSPLLTPGADRGS